MNPLATSPSILTGERILAHHRQRIEAWHQAGHDCTRALELLHLFETIIMVNAHTPLEYIRACAALLEPTMEPTMEPPPTTIPQNAQCLGTLDHTHFYQHGGIIWSFNGMDWSSICFAHEWDTRAESHAIAAQTAPRRAL